MLNRLRIAGRWEQLTGHLDFFPIKNVVKNYTGKDARADVAAAINVALMTFPMGMAFALMAGLPVYVGIIGAAAAAVVGPIFSGTRFLAFGPSNATAVMLLSALAVAGVDTVAEKAAILPTIVFLVGVLMILAAVSRVANFVQYISRTVVTGYITAAAVLIMANQLPNLVGVSLGQTDGTFYSVARACLSQWQVFDIPSIVLGGLTILVYLAIRRFAKNLPDMALTLLVACGLMFAVNFFSGKIFADGHAQIATLQNFGVGELGVAFPSLSPASLNTAFSAALAIAILGMIEGSSIGKSVAARAGARFDSNQELLGLGAANLACSIFGGMPASGSLTRSALSFTSGARTAFAGIISGVILFAAVFGTGNLMQFIPKPALAALVIFAGTRLINAKAIRLVTSATPGDRAVFFLTLCCGLVAPLDIAIYFGVGLSIILFLRKTSTPEIVEYAYNQEGQLAEMTQTAPGARDPEVSIVHIDGNLYFGSAEIFQEQLRRMLADEDLRVLILKFRNAHHLDATSAMLLEELVRSACADKRSIIICEVRAEVYRVFRMAKLVRVIGRENIFRDTPQNLTLSSARAIRHAYKLLGGREARVSIYAKARP